MDETSLPAGSEALPSDSAHLDQTALDSYGRLAESRDAEDEEHAALLRRRPR